MKYLACSIVAPLIVAAAAVAASHPVAAQHGRRGPRPPVPRRIDPALRVSVTDAHGSGRVVDPYALLPGDPLRIVVDRDSGVRLGYDGRVWIDEYTRYHNGDTETTTTPDRTEFLPQLPPDRPRAAGADSLSRQCSYLLHDSSLQGAAATGLVTGTVNLDCITVANGSDCVTYQFAMDVYVPNGFGGWALGWTSGWQYSTVVACGRRSSQTYSMTVPAGDYKIVWWGHYPNGGAILWNNTIYLTVG